MTELVYAWHHDGRITTVSWVVECPDSVPARVSALAFTCDGRILLVGDDAQEDYWWLPGGGVEEGESAEQALVRELDEEAGAVANDLELLGYRRVDDPVDGRSYIATYWCRVTLPASFVPRRGEQVTKNLLVGPDQFLDYLYWADDPSASHLLQLAAEIDRRRRRR